MPLEVQAPASHLPRIPRRDSRTGHEERSVIRPAVFPLQGAVPVQQKSCQHPHFTGSKPPASISASILYISREIATTCLCSASRQRQRKVRWKSLRATARRIILPSQNHAPRTPSWCQHQPSRCFSSGAVRWLVKFFGGLIITHQKNGSIRCVFLQRWCGAAPSMMIHWRLSSRLPFPLSKNCIGARASRSAHPRPWPKADGRIHDPSSSPAGGVGGKVGPKGQESGRNRSSFLRIPQPSCCCMHALTSTALKQRPSSPFLHESMRCNTVPRQPLLCLVADRPPPLKLIPCSTCTLPVSSPSSKTLSHALVLCSVAKEN